MTVLILRSGKLTKIVGSSVWLHKFETFLSKVTTLVKLLAFGNVSMREFLSIHTLAIKHSQINTAYLCWSEDNLSNHLSKPSSHLSKLWLSTVKFWFIWKICKFSDVYKCD